MKTVFRLIVLASVVVSFQSSAKLRGTIDGGQIRGVPIAIVPFKVVGGTSLDHQIGQVISNDLKISGKFEPISIMDFMSRPSRSEEVRYKDWRFIDAEVLVIGEVWTIGPDLYEVRFHIYDVAREQEIGAGKRIPNLRGEDLRTAAHIISDHIYQAFTGRPATFNSRIAYIKKAEIEFHRYRYSLMVADWDGYGAQEVYGSWNPLLSLSWSPDSKKLAFVSFSRKGSVVKVLELESGKHEVIAEFNGVNTAPAWSPDGTKLAYSSSRHGSPDVFTYDISTKQHRRINTHYGIDTEPAWSPDGRALLFTSNRSGRPQIYSVNLGDDSSTRITFDGRENANASYDFDAKKVLMVTDGGAITVMNEGNGRVIKLTNGKFDESPSFSPNGDMVLYASEQNFEPALIVASADGRVRTRLELVHGDVREPAWSPLR